MTIITNKQIRLTQRPQGTLQDSNFTWTEEPIDSSGATLASQEVLVEHLYAGLDPGLRGWMDDMHDSYAPPVELGSVMPCTCISRVVASNNDQWSVGDLMWGLGAWQHYQVLDAEYLAMMMPLANPSPIPLTAYLSVCGFTGLTAYAGMLEVAKPQAGETILISGAAGAVGSVAGQLAKLKADGCTLVGIAGSVEKCDWLTDEVGFDSVINYREVDDMQAAISQACPDGINVFFDNVGGDILDAALMNLAFEARVIMCGTISNYNDDAEDRPGPKNMWQLLVKNARIEGFTVSHYVMEWERHRGELAELVADNKLHYSDQIVVGLENTVDGFRSLFNGSNTGRVIMQFSDSV
jgi:NADPH-dependent curcumin reductase CurA